MPISKSLKQSIAQEEARIVFDTEEGQEADRPDFQGIQYRQQIEDVVFVRDVWDGTKALREGGETYLPRYAHEEDRDYDRRLARALLFNAFRLTVGGLTGMVFRKDPVTEDLPTEIEGELENIDMSGRDLPVFSRDTFEQGMIDGHGWIHVEMPKVDPAEVRVRLDERGSEIRPYWVYVPKADAINWRYEMRGGRPVLTLFVYREAATEDQGDFGQVVRERFRVLRPGSFQLWEKRADGGKVRFRLIDEGVTLDRNGNALGFIPIVWVPINRTGIYDSTPPLLDLAEENIEHRIVRSDYQNALTFASVPVPVFTGIKREDVLWGANHAIFLPEQGATAQILESSGTSLDASRQELKDTEARMAALGLQMLVRETRAAETAEAKQLDKAEKDSALAVAARRLQGALVEALEMHAAYKGIPLTGTVEVNRDYHDQTMSPQMVDVLAKLVPDRLSLETLWGEMQRGEVLGGDFDPDLERDRLEEPDLNALMALRGSFGGNGDQGEGNDE